jgi:putative sigma-54 modulation protein
MHFNVTFRHMEATEAIKDYAKEKIERIRKYFPDPIKAHVVLSTERGYQHVADVSIQLHNGIVLKGKESTEDMYSSIDLVAAKIERQVRKYKEKIQRHKPTVQEVEQEPVIHQVLDAASLEARAEAAEAIAAQHAKGKAAAEHGPVVIESEQYDVKPLSVDDAVMQMNLRNEDFLVFKNAETKTVNVVFRRRDGNYGLVETPLPDAK